MGRMPQLQFDRRCNPGPTRGTLVAIGWWVLAAIVALTALWVLYPDDVEAGELQEAPEAVEVPDA